MPVNVVVAHGLRVAGGAPILPGHVRGQFNLGRKHDAINGHCWCHGYHPVSLAVEHEQLRSRRMEGGQEGGGIVDALWVQGDVQAYGVARWLDTPQPSMRCKCVVSARAHRYSFGRVAGLVHEVFPHAPCSTHA